MIFVYRNDFVSAAKSIVRFAGSKGTVAMWYEESALWMVCILDGRIMYAQSIEASESVSGENAYSKYYSSTELKEFVKTLRSYGTMYIDCEVDEAALDMRNRYHSIVDNIGVAQDHCIPASGMNITPEYFVRALKCFRENCIVEYFSYSGCKNIYRFRNERGLAVYVAGRKDE